MRCDDRRSGLTVRKNDTEAAFWFRKAADQGYANAQDALGWLYHSGEGVPQDDAEAVIWWRRAAEQGYADAQYNLGQAYFNGLPEHTSERLLDS